MHTQKVYNYTGFINKVNKPHYISTAVLVSMLEDFKIINHNEAGVMYGCIINCHYDLNRIEKKKDNKHKPLKEVQ